MGTLNEMARLVREELLTLIQPVTLLSVNPERSTGKITGRFRCSGMLFDYNIGGQTVSYKPVGAGRSARADAEAALSAVADAWEIVAELAQSRQDTRCQKPDGTIYGTRGKCKQGKELKAEPKVQPQFTRRRTTQNWNKARATELQMRGTTALGRRVEAKGFVGSSRKVSQKAGGLRSNAGPTSLRRQAGTVGAGTRAGLAANAQQVGRKRSRAASKGTQKTPKAPANPARDRYKELSGRARRSSPYASAEENRKAAGAKRSLTSMINNRGAAPAPKRKRKSRRTEFDLRKYNKPPGQREAAQQAAYEAIVQATKRGQEAERESRSLSSRVGRVRSAIGEKVNAAKQALANEMEASRTRRANASRFRQQKKAAEVLQSPFTRRRDSYNAGYQEVMARLDWRD